MHRIKNKKQKNFFVNNKKLLISSVIILALIVIGVYSYDKYTTDKKRQISDNFNAITIDHSESSKDITLNKLLEIINQKDPTYSPLSLYFIIDNNLLSDQSEVNKLFDVIIDETSLDKEIKNLVIYKKALFNADLANEADLLNMLNPLINSEAFTSSSAKICFTFSCSEKSFSLSFQILEFSFKEQLFRRKNVINNANSLITQISV